MKYGRWVVTFLLLSVLLGGRGWTPAEEAARAGAADERVRMYTAAHLGGAAAVVRALPDDYLALAQGSELLVLDTLGTFEPRPIGKLRFSSLISDLEVHGHTAYVLAGARLHLVDLSQPNRPQQLARLTGMTVFDLAIDGEFLYLAGGVVQVYSLADPAAPRLAGSIDPDSLCNSPACSAWDVRQVASAFPYLYVRWRYSYCDPHCTVINANDVLDVSRPASPMLQERTADAESLFVREALPLGGYWLVQLADNEQPLELTQLRIVAEGDLLSLAPTRTLPYQAQDMAVQGDRLYLAAGDAGLRIVDVSDPLNAVQLGAEQTLAEVRSLAVGGSLAYLAGGSQGLGVVDVRDPAAPFYAGGYRTVGSVEHVLLAGETLYASSDRLDILDISNPEEPELLGSFPQAGALALAGDTLYLAAGAGGLLALDVGDPAAPQELDRLTLPGAARAVAVVGTYAYVASSAGLQVVAVADPAALALVETAAGFDAARIAAGSDFLALTSERHLHLFDLSDPAAPQPVLEYPFFPISNFLCNAAVLGLASYGEQVWVIQTGYLSDTCYGDWNAMLTVFERGPQGQWSLIGARGDQGQDVYLDELVVDGGQGYVLGDGLWLFAADDPLESDLYLAAGVSEYRTSLAASESGVVVGAGEDGLYLLQPWLSRELYLPVFAGQVVFHCTYSWQC